SVCAECHQEIHDQWKNSHHAKSVADSNVRKVWTTFITEGLDKEEKKGTGLSRKEMWICLGCHYPPIKDAAPELVKQIADLVVASVQDPDKTKKEAAVKELSKLNINCLSCHNYVRVAHPFVPDVEVKPKTIYVPEGKATAKDTHKELGFDTVKSSAIKKSEMCANCHHGCPPGVGSSECPTQYSSYQEDYIAKGGKETCQSCHMAGKEFKNHNFPGSRNFDVFRQWVRFKMDARPTTYMDHINNKRSPAVVVKIDVANNAGHGIPHG
ncbi:MAG: hypothetical protein HY756_03520, partial [Nitrospirae bacterium]|nr:hypothetical protein [Nitrospirota bacterium]